MKVRQMSTILSCTMDDGTEEVLCAVHPDFRDDLKALLTKHNITIDYFSAAFEDRWDENGNLAKD